MGHAVRLAAPVARSQSQAGKPRPFGAIVRDLLIERGHTTALGNPNWADFALGLDGVHYETLRKAVTGERRPAPKVMEAVAEALGVDPHIFYEYELHEVQQMFDPTVVGEDEAVKNLEAWRKLKKK